MLNLWTRIVDCSRRCWAPDNKPLKFCKLYKFLRKNQLVSRRFTVSQSPSIYGPEYNAIAWWTLRTIFKVLVSRCSVCPSELILIMQLVDFKLLSGDEIAGVLISSQLGAFKNSKRVIHRIISHLCLLLQSNGSPSFSIFFKIKIFLQLR